MRLFAKIAFTLAATVLATALVSTLAIAVVFLPQYWEMDRSAAMTNAERVYEFLQTELDALASSAGDWGHWDDTFVFAKSLNPSFIRNNLKQEDLETIHVDEFAIARFDRSIRYQLNADRGANALPGPLAGLKSVPSALWPEIGAKASRETFAGFAQLPSGPVIVAATAITDSNGNGPSPGVMLFARFAGPAFLQAVRDKTRLDFTLSPSSEGMPAGEDVIMTRTQNGLPVALTGHDGQIEAAIALTDVSGAPSFVVRVVTRARFGQLALRTLLVTLALLMIIGTVAGLMLAVFMRRAVTHPLNAIIAHTRAIASTGNLEKKLDLVRADEIGALAKAFDGMIGDLREARLQLQEKSFVSGMANVAAEMLHNLRNTLSPVATAIWKGRESLKDMPTDRLVQAGEELAVDGLDPDRKAKLARYVGATARHISECCLSAQREFETIGGFTGEIELLLKHQEDLSRGVRHIERISVGDIVASAAKHVSRSSARIELVIAPALERMPAVAAERIVLQQVFGNLVANAVQAIERHCPQSGRIAFDAMDRGKSVELSIADNGEGIPPEHMQSLFKRGFSSREGEGKGLGLHYCATSLNAMNGTIAVDSAGAGKGATFRVVLPVAESGEEAA